MANVNARRVEEILTSGITAGHYIAGSNITITENSDGTETIASTGGGGGGGFTPTETQLAAMNSGITEAKVTGYDALPDDEDVKDIVSDHFVAGSNITITDNVDGTQTIASTASGGTTDYSDLTNKPSINNVTLSGNKTTFDLGIDEVPDVTSSDDGKILKASYSGSTGTYGWGNLSSSDVTSVLSTAQQNAINSGITSTKVSGYDAIAGKMETFYPNLADIGEGIGEITVAGLDNVHSDNTYMYEILGLFNDANFPTELANKYGVVRGYFTDYGNYNASCQIVETTDGVLGARTYNQTTHTWSNWAFNVPGGGGTAPTAYTAVTAGTGVTDVNGGYVVSNNICTFNISCKFSSPSTGQTLLSGLPKPALKLTSLNSTIIAGFVVGSVSNSGVGHTGAHVYLTQGGNIIASDESYSSLENNYKVISGSYLVDTST